jgi:hypothetical protein
MVCHPSSFGYSTDEKYNTYPITANPLPRYFLVDFEIGVCVYHDE